jgi:hypothetical protein
MHALVRNYRTPGAAVENSHQESNQQAVMAGSGPLVQASSPAITARYLLCTASDCLTFRSFLTRAR